MAIEFPKELQPMAQGGVWLQPHSAEVPPTYVAHQAHITRLTLDGWRPVIDPRPELMAQLAAKKAAEQAKAEQERKEKEEAEEKKRAEKEDKQAKRIEELELLVRQLLVAQSEAKSEEIRHTSARRKAE
jgi:hypothetical protein